MRYTIAIASVGGAVLLMLLLRELGAGDDVRPALLVAVAISALYGGFGPGALALGLATLVGRDPVVLVTGAILAAACGGFRRTAQKSGRAAPEATESVPGSGTAPPDGQSKPGTVSHLSDAEDAPLKEVTSEATWRFHHEQPLDITLPEDEQVEHFYLYSVLAECNDAFARMYGFRSAADVVGTRLVVFLPPSNQENVDYLRRFIRSGYRLEDAESHEIDRYGHAKYFVNNLVGIFERGQLIGSWGTQRDVTNTKQGATQEYSSRLHSTNSSSQ
jgi:hypothetical protein